MSTNNVYICKEHDNCECKHYCKNCEKNICLVCTLIGEHSKHDHCTIPQAVTQCQEGVEKTSNAIDEMIKSLDDRYERIKAMKTKVQEQGEGVRNKIYEHYNELDLMLREQREQVKQQASDVVVRKEKVLAVQLTVVEQAKNEVLSLKEMKGTYEKNSDQDILSNNAAKQKQIIDHCLKKLKSRHDKINFEPEEKDDIELLCPLKSFFPLFCHLSVGSESLCVPTNSELLLPAKIDVKKQVTVTLFTRDAKGQYCSKGGNHVCMQLETCTGKITTLEVKDNCDGSYLASFVADQAGVVKVLVLVNGLQVRETPYSIVAYRNYKALNQPNKIFNDGGSLGHPWGIAVGRYGVWAVTDNSHNCVYVIDSEDQVVNKVGSHGKDNGLLNCPHGVAFDNENHLYVVDSGNHRVQKFGFNGNYLLQFGSRGSGDGQLNQPYGITTHDSRVYVTDKGNHRISVFQSDGQFCISFGSDQLGDPYDVAVTGNNQLLVADHSQKCIVTFTLDDDYVAGKLHTQGSNNGHPLNHPYSLATDVNGFILVTDDKHRVFVFDRAGSFIHCFGSTESGSKQFSALRSIALNSSKGIIYVCDSCNKKIQIFTNY
ncbi:E3 ubiquitin-protein ligase TRIM71-like [Dysidea avara]|uniref:E3 ubiquitin-protein ligase TRIM71-like n=1 Tax=Dysidea avara TaxID=196820 RepID=UPI0033338595